MSGQHNETSGLNHGRNWTTLPDDESVVDWSVRPDQGLVQGPLDLEFLRGRKVALSLEPGQVALLVCDDCLQAVYLDGAALPAEFLQASTSGNRPRVSIDSFSPSERIHSYFVRPNPPSVTRRDTEMRLQVPKLESCQ